MKFHSFALILLTCCLWACSQEKLTSPPLCQLDLPKAEIVESDVPERLNYSIDQQSLAQLMELDIQNLQCFASHQRTLHVYRAPKSDTNKFQSQTFFNEQKSTPPMAYFDHIPTPPTDLMNNWNRLSYFEYGSSNLKGLTTTSIIEVNGYMGLHWAAITLRSDAKPWHLWHEYIHYLIKLNQIDVQSFKKIPDKEQVRNLAIKLKDMESSLPENEPQFMAALQEFFNQRTIHVRSATIEEIVVESTLVDLIYNNPDLFTYSNSDLEETILYVEQYYGNYLFEHDSITRSLRSILDLNSISQPLRKLVSKYLDSLKDEHEKILLTKEQAQQQARELNQTRTKKQKWASTKSFRGSEEKNLSLSESDEL